MPPYISAYPPVLIFLPPPLCSFICMHLLSSPPSLFSVLFTSPTILHSLNPRHSSLKAHLSFNYTYTSTGHVFHISSPRERQGTWERDAAEQVFLSWGIFLNTSLAPSLWVVDVLHFNSRSSLRSQLICFSFSPSLQYQFGQSLFKLNTNQTRTTSICLSQIQI